MFITNLLIFNIVIILFKIFDKNDLK